MLSRSTPTMNTRKGSLKTKDRQFHNFVVTGGIVGCCNVNLRDHQARQSCQFGDLCFQWDGYKHVAVVSFIASHRRHDVRHETDGAKPTILVPMSAYTKPWWKSHMVDVLGGFSWPHDIHWVYCDVLCIALWRFMYPPNTDCRRQW